MCIESTVTVFSSDVQEINHDKSMNAMSEIQLLEWWKKNSVMVLSYFTVVNYSYWLRNVVSHL